MSYHTNLRCCVSSSNTLALELNFVQIAVPCHSRFVTVVAVAVAAAAAAVVNFVVVVVIFVLLLLLLLFFLLLSLTHTKQRYG